MFVCVCMGRQAPNRLYLPAAPLLSPFSPMDCVMLQCSAVVAVTVIIVVGVVLFTKPPVMFFVLLDTIFLAPILWFFPLLLAFHLFCNLFRLS